MIQDQGISKLIQNIEHQNEPIFTRTEASYIYIYLSL